MPYSTSHLLTSPPLGLTVAVAVAVVCLTEVAALVTTAGGLGNVLKTPSPPSPMPPALVADDPEVVGGVRRQAGDRRGDRDGARYPSPGSEEHGTIDP